MQQRDPAFIAEQTRLLRQVLGLTQQNLADAANLTTRTIEKVESGRHLPAEQTLRSIARGTSVTLGWFDKLTAEQEARSKAAIEHARKHMDMVPIAPVHSVANILATLNGAKACRFDASAVAEDVALWPACCRTLSMTSCWPGATSPPRSNSPSERTSSRNPASSWPQATSASAAAIANATWG